MKKLCGHLISRSPVKLKGSILVVALWSLCLLSAFAVILNYQIRQYLTLASRLDQRANLRLAAQAGVYRGITEIMGDQEKTYYCLADPWSNNPGAFKDVELGIARFSLTYDYTEPESGLAQTGYGCVDEDRKINVNKADMNTMARLFKAVLSLEDMQAQELAACLLDWRDADSNLSVPAGSAEDFYYSNLPEPYAAKNSDFETMDELLLVKGVSENVFEKVRDYVTIYGEGRINVNTAPAQVLFALGLDEDLARDIVAYRAGKDGQDGTADDNVFVSASDVVASITGAYALSVSQAEQLNSVAALYFSVNSDNFSIRSTARIGRDYALTVESVVRRTGKILYWREI